MRFNGKINKMQKGVKMVGSAISQENEVKSFLLFFFTHEGIKEEI